MVSPTRASQVRRSNLALVLDLVRRNGPMSRSALVAATGLTRSAIAGLLGELEGLRLVVEAAPASDGSPGRPSPVARVDDRYVGALAVEVFIDEIGVSIVSLDGVIVASVRKERSRRRLSLANTVRDVVRLVEVIGAQHRAGAGIERDLVGIGVSVPGLVRRVDNTIVVAPNLGWVEADFAGPLASALGGALPIHVGNDADLGARAESRFGAGVGANNLLFVSGEVGVGGGVIIDGSPLVGHSGFAGEMGHFPVNPDGRRCRCGATGCWETEIGEQALLRRAGLDEDGGTSELQKLFEMADAGDRHALAALDEEARWLAIGLTGLINVFDPDRVVLGGLPGRVLPYVEERLTRELAARRLGDVPRAIPVLGALLGASATTVGAAELAFDQLAQDPAGITGILRGA